MNDLKITQAGNQGVSTRVEKKIPMLGNAKGLLNKPDAELGN